MGKMEKTGKMETKVVRLPPGEGGDEVVEVGVNGVMTIIRRGEEVRVSGAVCEVLRNAGLIEGESA